MKVKVTIPTSLKGIKLSQYQKFLKICKDVDDEDFINHKMIEIFCGIDLNIVTQMQHKDVIEFVETLHTLFKKQYGLISEFDLDDKKFGFIPNLDEMTSGEYMDLDNYFKNWDDMHKAMAVLYRPITKKIKNRYIIEEYDGSDKYCITLRDMSLDIVLGAMVFFYHLKKDLLKSTMDCLENQEENSLKLDNLGEDGDGIIVSMHLLKEMLEDSQMLLNFPFINA